MYSNINSLNHIGKSAIIQNLPYPLYHGMNLLRISSKIDSLFLFYSLNTSKHKLWAMSHANQAVSQASINQTTLSKQLFSIPVKIEQLNVGRLLKCLDQTITLHEEKKRQLERLKSALLQKMFANKSGYPAVRFNGFEKVWNERRIGDVLFKKSAKNTDLQFDKTDILSVSSMSDMETSREINSSESYMKTYNKLLVGELAFEGHSSAKYPFGRFVINNYRDGIVSHIYDVYKFKEDMNIHFVAEFFKQKKTMYYPLVNSTTAARMMNSLVAKDFYKQQIRFPTLEEQDQIGKLIKEIDFICIQHDRKIKLMKRVKRSLLQMMFI